MKFLPIISLTNNNKKFDSLLRKYDFILVCDNEFYPQVKSELQNIRTKIQLRNNLLLWIEYFIEGGYKFSLISEMKITNVSNKKHMDSDFYIKQPM